MEAVVLQVLQDLPVLQVLKVCQESKEQQVLKDQLDQQGHKDLLV
jgi:hypothetical protein